MANYALYSASLMEIASWLAELPPTIKYNADNLQVEQLTSNYQKPANHEKILVSSTQKDCSA